MSHPPPVGGKSGRILRVVHHHPGRLRTRAVAFEDRADVAEAVKDELLAMTGVLGVSHNARTGSLLVTYSAGQVEPNVLLDAMVDAAALDGVIDEVNGDLPASEIRAEIFSGAKTVDDVVLELTGGRADLRTVVAGALFAGSVYSFVANPVNGRLPRWDNLLWWSYGILTGDHARAGNGEAPE